MPTGSVSNGVDAIYLRTLTERRFVIGRGFPKEYHDVDPYNYKLTADDSFIAAVQTRMERRFPPLAGARLVSASAALYDVALDWYPYAGARAGLGGYFDASGGSGHGFKIGPAIGRELADWIVDERTSADFARLSYDRVAQGALPCLTPEGKLILDAPGLLAMAPNGNGGCYVSLRDSGLLEQAWIAC